MDTPIDPHWDRLPHLFAGELPESEAQALRDWIDAVPERREAVTRLREVWQLTGVPVRDWNAEAALTAIQRRVSGEPGRVIARVGQPAPLPELPRLRSWRRHALAAAAAVSVLAGGALLWQYQSRPQGASSAVAFNEFRTRPGERLSLRLPDGTLVTLAPGSVLRQPATYGRSARLLFLDGEAAFAVTHDAARPLAVYTAHAVARDIGTRFLVRAYTADSVTNVVVAEGVVAVSRVRGHAANDATSSGPDSVVLTRGGRARMNANGDLELARGVPLDAYFGWTEGRLLFRDTPLAEAARQLGRWHGVEIRLADARTAQRRVTASFGDEPIADVIHRIAASLDLEVHQADRTFTLRAR